MPVSHEILLETNIKGMEVEVKLTKFENDSSLNMFTLTVNEEIMGMIDADAFFGSFSSLIEKLYVNNAEMVFFQSVKGDKEKTAKYTAFGKTLVKLACTKEVQNSEIFF